MNQLSEMKIDYICSIDSIEIGREINECVEQDSRLTISLRRTRFFIKNCCVTMENKSTLDYDEYKPKLEIVRTTLETKKASTLKSNKSNDEFNFNLFKPNYSAMLAKLKTQINHFLFQN